MFDWIGDLINGIVQAISDGFSAIGTAISSAIWNTMIQWFYETIYSAVAAFFGMISNMGAEIFELSWVQATVELFSKFGWALYIVGIIVAVFDLAIEYQTGRANIKNTFLNIFKGFFACSLINIVPIELYKFCITLQTTFSTDLAALFASEQTLDIPTLCAAGLATIAFPGYAPAIGGLLATIIIIAFAYCVIKIFFQNIKRGGILIVQMAVGSLYMFSVPRGYSDGFTQWCKQVIALCLTAFLQTTLLYLGLLTFPQNMLLGLGIMLSANEVPKIAQQFGLDTSARFNAMSVVHATSTAINLTRVIKAAK